MVTGLSIAIDSVAQGSGWAAWQAYSSLPSRGDIVDPIQEPR